MFREAIKLWVRFMPKKQTIREKSLSEREKALMRASEVFERKVIPHFNKLNESLDVGTGNGYTAFALARHFKKVVSIDSNPESLKIAENNTLKKNTKNIQFLIDGCPQTQIS